MACRKDALIKKWGEELVDILTGGEIICPYCRCVHSKGINYYFEGEPQIEDTTSKILIH